MTTPSKSWADSDKMNIQIIISNLRGTSIQLTPADYTIEGQTLTLAKTPEALLADFENI